MSQPVIHMVEGDNRPEFSCTVKNTSLEGYTVTGRLRRHDETVVLIPAVITDVLNGKFTVTFDAEDMLVGRHSFDILFESVDGGRFTSPARAPITVIVRSAIA